MKIIIILLFTTGIFANDRILKYLGKHPEITRETIEALQNRELIIGMDTEQAMLILGYAPLQRSVVDVDGQKILVWTYENQYLFFLPGTKWLLSNWERRIVNEKN